MPVLSMDKECPPDSELVDLIEGRLAGSAVGRIHAHLATCGACREFLDLVRTRGAGAGDATPTVRLDGSGRLLAGMGARGAWELLGGGTSVGRYLILSLLGRGGMGEVYAAYDPDLDRRVAVKVVHVARGSDEDARRRLMREARALGKLSHPNVVQIYDAGEHEGDVFIAMELVDGSSLDVFCKGPPRPAWEEVLAAYLDAARGLGAAHDKGIVHRDVKPSNMLRGKDGRVRVADLGLAAMHDAPWEPPAPSAEEDARLDRDAAGSDDDDASRLTTTGAVLGTPIYLAPEQHAGVEATAASDQYAFCVALHEGLYGALPFPVVRGRPTKGMLERLGAAKALGPSPEPPPEPLVPAHVHRALLVGLAPDPRARHPSMAALAAALGGDPNAGGRRRQS